MDVGARGPGARRAAVVVEKLVAPMTVHAFRMSRRRAAIAKKDNKLEEWRVRCARAEVELASWKSWWQQWQWQWQWCCGEAVGGSCSWRPEVPQVEIVQEVEEEEEGLSAMLPACEKLKDKSEGDDKDKNEKTVQEESMDELSDEHEMRDGDRDAVSGLDVAPDAAPWPKTLEEAAVMQHVVEVPVPKMLEEAVEESKGDGNGDEDAEQHSEQHELAAWLRRMGQRPDTRGLAERLQWALCGVEPERHNEQVLSDIAWYVQKKLRGALPVALVTDGALRLATALGTADVVAANESWWELESTTLVDSVTKETAAWLARLEKEPRWLQWLGSELPKRLARKLREEEEKDDLTPGLGADQRPVMGLVEGSGI